MAQQQNTAVAITRDDDRNDELNHLAQSLFDARIDANLARQKVNDLENQVALKVGVPAKLETDLFRITVTRAGVITFVGVAPTK